MSLTVTLNHPGFEKGEEISMANILLINGEPTEVSDEAAALYEKANGRSLSNALDGKTNFTVSGSHDENFDLRADASKNEDAAPALPQSETPPVPNDGTDGGES